MFFWNVGHFWSIHVKFQSQKDEKIEDVHQWPQYLDIQFCSLFWLFTKTLVKSAVVGWLSTKKALFIPVFMKFAGPQGILFQLRLESG